YTRWDNADTVGAPYVLDAIRQMLAFEERATKTQFYERDLAELSRTYLHQYIAGRVQGAMALLTKAKKAAKDQTYSNRDRNQNLEDLKKLDTEITRAHATLIRIISTRKDMSLDEAIIEATKTPGANRNLAQAIREHQSGTFADGFPLVDSIEYHKQLKATQLRHLLDYVKQELTNPTDKAAPPWRQFSLHGAREFIERSRPVPYDQKAEKTAPSEILKEFLNAAG
ncbi:hypothetical protein HQ576_08270, partial [bacterium]|nr:hypothetical protein [bacterium]